MFTTLAALVAVIWQGLAFGGSMMPAPSGPPLPKTQAVCSLPSKTTASCTAKVRADKAGGVKPFANFSLLPGGYTAKQLRSAYNISSAQGTGSSMAVVVAYDSPNIKKDLDAYDAAMGLPVFPNCSAAVTTACFNKMNEYGSNWYPMRNRGWSLEADLDVQMAHATCPGCKLTLVEANSSYFTDLMQAVDEASSQAKLVSMSWGANEFGFENFYDTHFQNPNVVYVAASGDGGYGTSWPASSPHVLSAGGTSLYLNAAGQRTSPELVWNGTGSGCSLYEAKPTWQTVPTPDCTANRVQNDASADADPYTGADIYASYSPYGSGWFIIGGTSLSTPLLGGTIADAPAPANQTAFFNHLYAATSGLNDVLAGSNGFCSPDDYLCNGAQSYDGPSGLGSPNGLSAF